MGTKVTVKKHWLLLITLLLGFGLARIFALESWCFLVAVLIFANVSFVRKLKEPEANMPTNAPLSSKENIPASYLLVIGNIFKVIGFTLTAIGNQIKANIT